MRIYESAVRRPITTLLLFVGIVLLGLFSFKQLAVDLYPEIEPPFISVFTFYQGASAEDIETNVTELLENHLNTIPNLKTLTSNSEDNYAMLFLEFEWGTNLDEASNSIRDALGRVTKLLPDDCEQPQILKFNTNLMPIISFSITAEESFAALPEIVEDVLANPLNRIDGIGAITISGGGKRQIQVNVDPAKLEAYHLTVEQIGMAISQENRNLPAGMLDMGNNSFPLRVQGEFQTSETIGNIVVGHYQGSNIFLRDVAVLNDSLQEQQYVVERDGAKAIKLSIQKQSGANTVEIVHQVEEEMKRLVRNLPADVHVETMFNTAEFIQGSLNALSQTVMYAAIFVILVVLFFLGRWRATLIIIITIPVSLVVSFIYLYLTGNTINIISLSSLSIAIGMVVDDAIVVLENIMTQLERGSSPREAAIYGTNEVGLAVVATTLTVVAVFLPLTMVSGMSGIMFRQLGFIVTIVISVSTLSALTLTPMLSSRLMRRAERGEHRRPNALQRGINRALDGLDNIYARSLAWATHNRTLTIILAFLVFAGSLAFLPQIKTAFMPESDESRITLKMTLPVGVGFDYVQGVARHIEEVVREHTPELEIIVSSYGPPSAENVAMAFAGNSANNINIDIRLVKPWMRDRTVMEIGDALRDELAKIPELDKFEVNSGGGGAGGGTQIEVNVFGQNLDVTSRIADELAEKIRRIPGARDVDVKRDPFKMEYNVKFDRERLAEHGLNTTTAAMYVRNRINGLTASKYREGGKEYDILVRYDKKYRNTLDAIRNITMYDPRGNGFKLSEVAEVREFYAPPSIKRENRKRVVTITCGLYKESLGKLVDGIWAAADELELPTDVVIGVGGTAKEQQDSQSDLGTLLILVIILVYIVMASQFESFREPFIIMLSLPFAFTGVILSLVISGESLNLTSTIGAIMLVGIVVKNGIVLIDFINLLRARGYSTFRAVVEGGKSRLRPVLMTALTTILGMLPLALSTGEGSEMWRPMGVAVIGGLTFSTFLTLIVVPAVYASFASRTIKRSRRKNRLREARA